MSGRPQRVRDVVYVVGAGFSAGLGYPLTKSLLIDVWTKLPGGSREQLAKIIQLHHPDFDPARTTSFPDIEQLLTEIAVNLDLFDASRPIEGRFKRDELEGARGPLRNEEEREHLDALESSASDSDPLWERVRDLGVTFQEGLDALFLDDRTSAYPSLIRKF